MPSSSAKDFHTCGCHLISERAARRLVFKAYRLDRKSDIECFRSCCSSVRLKSMVIFALVCQRPSWALARMLR
ncbi:Uncharacterised protein [Mycobacteroides abscessus subsp. abscessus]|nr:Uncharacterised protein [Mycobacteroides abscessus subsp. abscessus]